MKPILVFSWFYPPVNSSEGLATYKLLNSSRFEYLVFTQKSSSAWSFGFNAELPGSRTIQTVCAEAQDPESWVDAGWRYYLQNRDHFSLVMTRSMPPECHALGLRIKRAFPETKWIASFGDPIRDNPYSHIDCSLYACQSARNRINRLRRQDPAFLLAPGRLLRTLLWDLRHRDAVRLRRELASIENGTISHADRLLFNNPSQLRYMLRDPAMSGKAVVLPHCYDRRLYADMEKPSGGPGNRIRFVFTGQLNETRSARPLLDAIRRLREARPDLEKRAEFVFYGDMPDADLACICRWGLGALVRFEAPLSYLDSLREAVRADWLLHIDGNIGAVCRENVFFAGKLADYFGAGTPILAITMPKGAAADWLRKAKALVLSYSVNEIKQALYQIVYEGLRPEPNRAFLAGFSSERTAAVFDREVQELLHEQETDPLSDHRRRDHGAQRGARAGRRLPDP